VSARYVRNAPAPKDDVSAALVSGAAAALVGLVTFYLARILFARERVVASAAGSEEAARTRE
jgi:hypothetical protein